MRQFAVQAPTHALGLGVTFCKNDDRIANGNLFYISSAQQIIPICQKKHRCAILHTERNDRKVEAS